ncbi:acyltransferase family protein [Billgrantia endophytica]|uniref:Acyltransferase 3 domain-containing protein n=1 Tax=Billgrantia endophytica TaxID=2033802 RepID=A0A2N7U7K8_9GAMM|nr:acyltransferase [Halomonas endophytica]PMR76408.1 hypothetical protein C1H69_04980 [Halomonas endophytica]
MWSVRSAEKHDNAKLSSIQAVRAVAAWAVVTGHLLSVATMVSNGLPVFSKLYAYFGVLAHAGVDAFFVISGAIMVLLYGKDSNEPRLSATLRFLAKRIIRIYPLFWVTAAVTYYAGVRLNPESFIGLLRQIMLIDVPIFHPVAWTLVYEMLFYVSVGITILIFGRHRRLGFFFLVAAIFLSAWLNPHGVFGHPIIIEFAFGIAAGSMYRWRSVAPRFFVIVGSVLLGSGMIYVSGIDDLTTVNIARIWALAIPVTLLIYGIMCLERDQRLTVPAWLVRAGDESYSVYLWHFGIIIGLGYYLALKGMQSILITIVYMIVCVVLVAIASRYSYLVFERPIMTRAFRTSVTTEKAGATATDKA